jgi:hypothetical protein
MRESNGTKGFWRRVILLPVLVALVGADTLAQTKTPAKVPRGTVIVENPNQPGTSGTKRIVPLTQPARRTAPRRITTPTLTLVGRKQPRRVLTTPTLVIVGRPHVARTITTPSLVLAGRGVQSQITVPALTLVGPTGSSTQNIATPALQLVGVRRSPATRTITTPALTLVGSPAREATATEPTDTKGIGK